MDNEFEAVIPKVIFDRICSGISACETNIREAQSEADMMFYYGLALGMIDIGNALADLAKDGEQRKRMAEKKKSVKDVLLDEKAASLQREVQEPGSVSKVQKDAEEFANFYNQLRRRGICEKDAADLTSTYIMAALP